MLGIRKSGNTHRRTTQIREAAVQDLFALMGEPTPQDGALGDTVQRLLRDHVGRVARGHVDTASAWRA